MTELGIVIIGRNEGERLRRCLTSVSEAAHCDAVVYVDSGSADQSAELAESFGVDVVALDTSIPFSAGRARNEGFRHLIRKYPQLRFIQFVDDYGYCKSTTNATYDDHLLDLLHIQESFYQSFFQSIPL